MACPVCFGGDDLKDLYVVTGSRRLDVPASRHEREHASHSGHDNDEA